MPMSATQTNTFNSLRGYITRRSLSEFNTLLADNNEKLLYEKGNDGLTLLQVAFNYSAFSIVEHILKKFNLTVPHPSEAIAQAQLLQYGEQLMKYAQAQKSNQPLSKEMFEGILVIFKYFPNLIDMPLDKHNNTALIWAANFGLEKELDALLKADADPRIKGNLGKNAREWAEFHKHSNIVLKLTMLEFQNKIYTFRDAGLCKAFLMTYSLRHFDTIILPFFVAHKLELATTLTQCFMDVFKSELKMYGNSSEALDLIFKVPELINEPIDRYNTTALIWAANDGNKELLERLLKSGADPSIAGNEGKNARQWAEAHKRTEIALQLAKSELSGAVLEYQTINDNTKMNKQTTLFKITPSPQKIKKCLDSLQQNYFFSVILPYYSQNKTKFPLEMQQYLSELAKSQLRKATTLDVIQSMLLVFPNLIHEPVNTKNQTPLMIAAAQNNIAAIKSLLGLHPDPKAIDADGLSAYDIAVKHSMFANAKLIAEYEAPLAFASVEQPWAKKSLTKIAERNFLNVLIPEYQKIGAETVSPELRSFMLSLAKSKFSQYNTTLQDKLTIQKIFPELLNERINQDNDTLLIYAAWKGDINIVKQLLESNPNLILTGQNNLTARQWAAHRGKNDIEKLIAVKELEYALLDSEGAKKYLADSNNTTTNKFQVIRAHPVLKDFLVNKTDTLLICAAREKDLGVVAGLLEIGADILKKGDSQLTARQTATIHGHEVIQNLLAEKEFECALEYPEYAKQFMADSCVSTKYFNNKVALIQKYPTLRDMRVNTKSDTVLILAAFNGNIAVVKALLELNVDVTIKGENNLTARQWAINKGFHAIAELLAEKELALALEKNDTTTVIELLKQHPATLQPLIAHLIQTNNLELITTIMSQNFFTMTQLQNLQRYVNRLGLASYGAPYIINKKVLFEKLNALDTTALNLIRWQVLPSSIKKTKQNYFSQVYDVIHQVAAFDKSLAHEAYVHCAKSKTATYLQLNILGRKAQTVSKFEFESQKNDGLLTSAALLTRLSSLDQLLHTELTAVSARLSSTKTKQIKDRYRIQVQELIDNSGLEPHEKQMALNHAANSLCAGHRQLKFWSNKDTKTQKSLQLSQSQPQPPQQISYQTISAGLTYADSPFLSHDETPTTLPSVYPNLLTTQQSSVELPTRTPTAVLPKPSYITQVPTSINPASVAATTFAKSPQQNNEKTENHSKRKVNNPKITVPA